MNDESINAHRMPVVKVVDGEAMADSRDVAAYFDKRHEEVVRAIRGLHCSQDFTLRNFAEREGIQQHSTGATKVRSFLMTVDGFMFLAMGFTGIKAAQLKEKYIVTFRAQEAELRTRRVLNTSVPHEALTWMRQVVGPDPEVAQLKAALAAEKARAERAEALAADRLEMIEKACGFLNQVAAVAGGKRKELIALKANGLVPRLPFGNA